MRTCLCVLSVLWFGSAAVHAQGLMVPEDKSLTPLAVVKHHGQRHHRRAGGHDQGRADLPQSDRTGSWKRPIVFPVPKGASVNEFAMWVDGKEVSGELVEADKARTIYTDIVRRTQDPGLLEYIGNNLLASARLPRPRQRRAEGDAQLHVRQRPGQRLDRVHLSAEGRRQGRLGR